jgi:predicted AAA+ superfamily ATPase
MTEKFIPRKLSGIISVDFFKGKAIIMHGPRQCGKTTLVRHLVEEKRLDAIWLNGDDDSDRNLFDTVSQSSWRQILGNNKVVVIDEAQMIPRVGVAAKLLIDHFPDVQAILTGSSSFQLSNLTQEPLTGRKYEYQLFPFSFSELVDTQGFHNEYSRLPERLLFGSYPEIVINPADARRHLKLLCESYLFRDLLQYDGIRKPNLLRRLVRALALQIGSEVSIAELASLLNVSSPTINTYISLLEKAYIVFTLPSMNRNRRNEIRKGRKIYFWDIGIRNAILDDFKPIGSRSDVGHLWENYLVAERLKANQYLSAQPISYFWRTKDQFEVDYVEENESRLAAWEFKWRADDKATLTRAFTNAYPKAVTSIITPRNFQDFFNPPKPAFSQK